MATNAAALRRGAIGARPLAVFPSPLRDELPVAEVPDFDSGGTSRTLALSRQALDEALAAAGIERGSAAAAASSLHVGTISGKILDLELEHRAADAAARLPLNGPPTGRAARELAREYGFGGRTLTYNSACTSSVQALYQAMLELQSGATERAVVLGVDSLNAITFHGFASLYLLDPAGCRPFDRDRRGIQIGEGAAALVLERTTSDEAFELALPASRSEPVHPTAMAPDGLAGEGSMRAALARAGVRAADVVAVKAHGNGTPDNDLAEGHALQRVFDQLPPVTSIKHPLGHTMGAAGLVELAAYVACLRAGFVPACTGFTTFDPDIGVEPLRSNGSNVNGAHVLNWFGFGGSLLSMVVRCRS